MTEHREEAKKEIEEIITEINREEKIQELEEKITNQEKENKILKEKITEIENVDGIDKLKKINVARNEIKKLMEEKWQISEIRTPEIPEEEAEKTSLTYWEWNLTHLFNKYEAKALEVIINFVKEGTKSKNYNQFCEFISALNNESIVYIAKRFGANAVTVLAKIAYETDPEYVINIAEKIETRKTNEFSEIYTFCEEMDARQKKDIETELTTIEKIAFNLGSVEHINCAIDILNEADGKNLEILAETINKANEEMEYPQFGKFIYALKAGCKEEIINSVDLDFRIHVSIIQDGDEEAVKSIANTAYTTRDKTVVQEVTKKILKGLVEKVRKNYRCDEIEEEFRNDEEIE